MPRSDRITRDQLLRLWPEARLLDGTPSWPANIAASVKSPGGDTECREFFSVAEKAGLETVEITLTGSRKELELAGEAIALSLGVRLTSPDKVDLRTNGFVAVTKGDLNPYFGLNLEYFGERGRTDRLVLSARWFR